MLQRGASALWDEHRDSNHKAKAAWLARLYASARTVVDDDAEARMKAKWLASLDIPYWGEAVDAMEAVEPIVKADKVSDEEAKRRWLARLDPPPWGRQMVSENEAKANWLKNSTRRRGKKRHLSLILTLDGIVGTPDELFDPPDSYCYGPDVKTISEKIDMDKNFARHMLLIINLAFFRIGWKTWKYEYDGEGALEEDLNMVKLKMEELCRDVDSSNVCPTMLKHIIMPCLEYKQVHSKALDWCRPIVKPSAS